MHLFVHLICILAGVWEGKQTSNTACLVRIWCTWISYYFCRGAGFGNLYIPSNFPQSNHLTFFSDSYFQSEKSKKAGNDPSTTLLIEFLKTSYDGSLEILLLEEDMNFNSRAASLTVRGSIFLRFWYSMLTLFYKPSTISHRKFDKEEGFFLFLLILQQEGLI